MLLRWRARDILIRWLEESAVLGVCLLGSAVLLIRGWQGLMSPSSWHPVPSMDPFVVRAQPAAPAIARRIVKPSFVRVAIHPPIKSASARHELEQKKALALVLIAAAAHKSASALPPVSAGNSGSSLSESEAQPAPATQTADRLNFNLAQASDSAVSVALWTERELMQAYDAAVVFVSDRLIPDRDVTEIFRELLDALSDQIRSLGSGSGVDLQSLGGFSDASLVMMIVAFLAALALCLLGPIYLASRSERPSHAHFFRLEGRR